ncbi:MAG: type IV secretory system conjugative DNA transfer family protein [Hyphomicrobiales bacterium]|nr:type IV secretory system conjugative DNA transfer family protein [Hyphomicrobiales bacterium]MCP5372050.1 type IV secretory system conjugative DNA transfer family protein [Hyphomicrobiales bacterium]
MKIRDHTPDLTDGVPRGVASRFLKAQTVPQARWQSQADILASPALRYDPRNPAGKILIGAIGDTLIGLADNRHVMTTAGSRAGKSVMLIGNLLFYDGSVLATDPKGELARTTAMRRAAMGQKIVILDPFGQVEGEAARFRGSYNPLTRLTLESLTIVEDAVQIADALVVSTGQEKDPHWNESAKGYLFGLILYVAVGSGIADGDRHLATVRKLVNQTLSLEPDGKTYALPRRIIAAARQLAADGHEDVALALEGSMRGFYEKAPDEMASVLSSVHRHTQFLDYRAMRSVLSGHDVDLEDLKRDPDGVTIYLVLPATRMGMCSRWLRLFVNQLLDAMEREKTVPRAPVLACLDEFPVLGFMSQLQDAAGQIASFHVKLWVVMQDWGQGKSLYGDRFESFAANAGVFQAFGNVDLTTTEYISKRLGRTVVEVARQSDTASDQREKGLSGRTVSGEVYDLLTPDEVSRLFGRDDPLKRQLVLWAGLHPMILQRVNYYDPKGPLAAYL